LNFHFTMISIINHVESTRWWIFGSRWQCFSLFSSLRSMSLMTDISHTMFICLTLPSVLLHIKHQISASMNFTCLLNYFIAQLHKLLVVLIHPNLITKSKRMFSLHWVTCRMFNCSRIEHWANFRQFHHQTKYLFKINSVEVNCTCLRRVEKGGMSLWLNSKVKCEMWRSFLVPRHTRCLLTSLRTK
jgi:hypothetical protein